MEFRVLGPLAVTGGQAPLPAAARPRGLLALLLLHAGEVLSPERIIDELWGDAAPARAANSLQVYVSQLRRALEPDRARGEQPKILTSVPGGYRLDLAGHGLDAERFRDLADRGAKALASADPPAAAELLSEALSLWRGEPLVEFRYEQFALAHITSLEERRLTAVEDRFEALLQLGRHVEVVDELASLTAAHPLRERLWEELLLALYRSGRQADALRAFQEARAAAVDELGVEPGPRLQRLERAVLNQDETLEFVPLALPQSALRPQPLPLPLTSFVGREEELERLTKLCRQSRLVTVVGPGGAGKTRLGLEAAGMLKSGVRHVIFVELAALDRPELVGAAIARAAGVEAEADAGPLNSFLAAQVGEETMLVLDNCEHLVEECAQVVKALLVGAAGITVLATSRELLRLPGEAAFSLGALGLPDADEAVPVEALDSYEAVRLFLDRARAARPSLTLRDEEAASVLAICRRVDGLPLAIELAAARVRTMSVADLAARIDRRISVLSSGDRTSPRHTSIAALIDWSHQLLTSAEQEVLARLSVFAGSWSLDAAEAVVAGGGIPADDVATLVSSLVDKSLVTMTEREGLLRFRLLEAVREYAGARLDEGPSGPATRAALLQWGLESARRDAPRLVARDPGPRTRLQEDAKNLSGALEWAFGGDGDAERGTELLVALKDVWMLLGEWAELDRWLAAAGERISVGDVLGRKLLLARGQTAYRRSEIEAAGRDFSGVADAARAEGDTDALAAALNDLARVAHWTGDVELEVRLLDESLSLSLELGDRHGTATTLHNLGQLHYGQGRYDEAERVHREALAIREELGDLESIAASLNDLGSLAAQRGDHQVARSLNEQSLDLSRLIGDRRGMSTSLNNLCVLAFDVGDLAEARRAQEQSVAVHRALGDRRGTATGLNNLAMLAQSDGHLDEAESLLVESIQLVGGHGDVRSRLEPLINLAALVLQRGDCQAAGSLAAEALDLARSLGDELSVARSLNMMGSLARAAGDGNRAYQVFAEALVSVRRLGVAAGIAAVLGNLGDLARERGDTVAARGHLEESLAVAEAASLHDAALATHVALGHLARGEGRLDDAASSFATALELLGEGWLPIRFAGACEGLAAVAARVGDYPTTEKLLATAAGIRTRLGAPVPTPDREWLAALTAETAEAVGQPAAPGGVALTLEQAEAAARKMITAVGSATADEVV